MLFQEQIQCVITAYVKVLIIPDFVDNFPDFLHIYYFS